MPDVHLAVGIAVIFLNLVAALVGGASWLRHDPSVSFWYLLRAAQVAVFAQVLVGALLVVSDREASDGLHYVYGLLPLLVSFLAEGARAGAAAQELGDVDFHALPSERQRTFALAIVRRETGIMTVSCIVIFFLALRAAGTTHLL
jgi:hypothetical protein